MKQKIFFYLLLPGIISLIILSCKEEENRSSFPLSAEIFHSASGRQVAFTALTHSADSWEWDFGDGNTSTEKDPVHEYETGGYYIATLTARSSTGNSVTKELKLAIELTPYSLLTGDHTVEGYNGKTWKLNQAHSVNDKLVNTDAGLTLMDDDIESLPSGAFDMYLGLPEAYNDQFTFHNDGSYSQNTTDGSSFGGIVYAMVMQQMGLTSIIKTGGEAVFGADAFALTSYTPSESATFVLKENVNFSIPTIPDFATSTLPSGLPIVTYQDVMTLEFPESDAFIGIRDFHREVIIEEITDNSMRLIMFLSLSPDAIVSQDPLVVLSTTAMILSFEVVQ